MCLKNRVGYIHLNYLWIDYWGWWNSNFVDFTFLRTERSSLSQSLTIWNRNISKECHTHSTHEFLCRYFDEKFIFLKETRFCRNTEKGRLAYSPPQMPSHMVDIVLALILSKMFSMFSYLVLKRVLHLEMTHFNSYEIWSSQRLPKGMRYIVCVTVISNTYFSGLIRGCLLRFFFILAETE